MAALPLEQPNVSSTRPVSIWIATAALIALTVGNFIVVLLVELSQWAESKADASPMSWFLMVWLSLYTFGAWTGRGPRWAYIAFGAFMGSLFALLAVIIAACRSPIWEGVLLLAYNGSLSFVVCFAMATESAKRYFESNRTVDTRAS